MIGSLTFKKTPLRNRRPSVPSGTLRVGQSKALLVGLYPFSQVSFLYHGLLYKGGLVRPNQMVHIVFYPPRGLIAPTSSVGGSVPRGTPSFDHSNVYLDDLPSRGWPS